MASDETGLTHACGVFACIRADGVSSEEVDVASVISLGLVSLQHRGQESAGIVTNESGRFHQHKGMGLASQIFQEQHIKSLTGNMGIGHTRYSTAGSSELVNCQPFVVDTIHGQMAVGHNGELVNAKALRKKVLLQGTGLSTGSDSEVITQLLTATPPCGEPDGANWPGRIYEMMQLTQISYSLVIMTKRCIYAVRDPHGNRPLCIGKLRNLTDSPQFSRLGGEIMHNGHDSDISNDRDLGWVVSSESCGFHSFGASMYREVKPGEIIELTAKGINSVRIVPPQNPEKPMSFCIFEYVYFARPDSMFEGQMVYGVRQQCGKQLAIEAPVEAELVSTVPESATPAALGYSLRTGIPYVEVLTKNRYVGRTFIQPSNRLRKLGVARKFGPISMNFKGKRIVLIDDSIVRGNTMGPIIKLLKQAGAREVHIRVASPPVKYPCYMGINIPTKEELIANRMNADQLAKELGADSLVYLSLEGLLNAVQVGIDHSADRKTGHCTACLSGKYPVQLDW